jgi:hypothetical protein
VYVVVPPLNEVVVDKVALLPELIAFGETEITGATRAGLTTTETALDVTDVPTLSVTLSSNCHVPVVDRAPVDTEAGEVQEDELPRLL